MSISHNHDGLFVNTGLLQDHVSRLREEKKTASRLYANIAAMRSCSPNPDVSAYNSLLRDIERLIVYFDKMASVLSIAEEEAVHLSHKLGYLIEEDTLHAKHTIAKSIML